MCGWGSSIHARSSSSLPTRISGGAWPVSHDPDPTTTRGNPIHPPPRAPGAPQPRRGGARIAQGGGRAAAGTLGQRSGIHYPSPSAHNQRPSAAPDRTPPTRTQNRAPRNCLPSNDSRGGRHEKVTRAASGRNADYPIPQRTRKGWEPRIGSEKAAPGAKLMRTAL
jgi:hypothetical protein